MSVRALRRSAVFVAALLTLAAAPAARAADPVYVAGNPDCADIDQDHGETWLELKVDPPTAGTHSNADLTVTVSNIVNGQYFDFTADPGVDAVIVKGGPNASAYVYTPDATSGTGLHAPDNGGQPYGLSHISFCYDILGSISGTKWHDVDADGVRDGGEPVVAGYRVYLDLDGNGSPGAGEPVATTNAMGVYRFDNLASGTYTVREVPDAQQDAANQGLRCSYPAATCAHTVVVDTSARVTRHITGKDFGNYRNGRIVIDKVTVGSAANQSVKFDFDAAGFGADFKLSAADTAAEFSVKPDASGAYKVTETVAGGFELTGLSCVDGATGDSSTSGATATAKVQSGETVTCTFTNTAHPPDITVVKDNDADGDGTYSDTETVPGGATYPYVVTYRATITNASKAAAKIDTLTDDKVAAPLRTAKDGLLDCADAIGMTLAADGGSLVCFFDATFDSPPGAELVNTVDVCASNPAGSDCDDDTSKVRFPGKVSVVKAADAATVSAGDEIGFTMTVSNAGPGEANGVTLTDTLPAGAGLSWSVDAGNSDAGCAIAGGLLTCDFGTLASGASKKVHVTSPTTKASCAEVDNTAEATSTDSGGGSDSASTTVLCGAIAITKEADADSVAAGGQIGFTIAVTNTGDGEARGVTVTDTLPAKDGLSWSVDAGGSDAGCAIAGGVLTCDFGTLPKGASKKVHIVSPTTTASCGAVDNTAQVTTSNDGEGSASDSMQVTCPAPQQPQQQVAPTTVTPPATTPPRQEVLPETVVAGASRLQGPSSCVSRAFRARINGRRIKSVTWRIDGRIVARFSSRSGEATKTSLRVNPRSYGRGLHRLTARVTYNRAAQTRAKTVRMTFRLCARSAQAPRFTG